MQFSQEGDLNSRVRYDLILKRLAEDEKTFRLAVVNLPREIDFAFLDPATNASLTQLKFSEEVTRQQLELELQIPEKLSRHFVDQTVEFYVFVTEQAGTLEVGGVHLSILPPMGWIYETTPDTIARILPGEKEPITIALHPPRGAGRQRIRHPRRGRRLCRQREGRGLGKGHHHPR